MNHVIVREDYPVVKTSSGPVRGLELDGVVTFRGVPYAEAERFGAPQPPKAWSEVRDCFVWGDTCPNPEWPLTTLFSTHRYWLTSDNCLNLNIWTKDMNGKKPVMFWIHGGGYYSGSSIDEALTEGDALAATGEVVVVSVNHRLNCLGFLDLSEFSDEFAHSANAGMEDLVAALQWVKENIAQFGGDPNNVTIFGQSGGGGKIMTLMQMPSADGLYHKAIIQSGVMTNQPIHYRAAEHGRLTMQHLGLDKGDALEIRNLPYERIYEAAEQAAREMGSMFRDIAGPHPDGVTLLDDYSKAGFRPEVAHIPVMVGNCAGELSLFSPAGLKKPNFSTSDLNDLTMEEKIERLRTRFGDKAEAIAAEMQVAYPQMDVLYAFSVDGATRPGTVLYAEARAEAADAPVYNYMMSYIVPALEGKLAWHGADLGFTFGNLDKSEVLNCGEHARELMVQMRDAWLNFAKYGDPNHDLLPQWAPFTAEHPICMMFDTPCYVSEGHDKDLMPLLKPERFGYF